MTAEDFAGVMDIPVDWAERFLAENDIENMDYFEVMRALFQFEGIELSKVDEM